MKVYLKFEHLKTANQYVHCSIYYIHTRNNKNKTN